MKSVPFRNDSLEILYMLKQTLFRFQPLFPENARK